MHIYRLLLDVEMAIEREVEKHAGPSVGVERGRGKREGAQSVDRQNFLSLHSTWALYGKDGRSHGSPFDLHNDLRV